MTVYKLGITGSPWIHVTKLRQERSMHRWMLAVEGLSLTDHHGYRSPRGRPEPIDLTQGRIFLPVSVAGRPFVVGRGVFKPAPESLLYVYPGDFPLPPPEGE